MYYFMDETAAATREMGIRGVLSGVLFDVRPELLRDAEPFIKRWRDDDLIKPSVGPHAVYTCSEETLLKAKDIAERYDVMIHIHLSETRNEVDTFVNQRHMTPVELTPRDMRILAERRANVAHCPVSNLKLASGIAPVATLIEHGVNVCLGTDGASSNNNLDIFEEMKVAAVVQKCSVGRSAILPVDTVWRMVTENAYRAFSLDIGIRPGALADLALINMRRPWFTPETSVLSHLVYSMSGEVSYTICNGRVLMRDGVIEGEDKILEEAQRCYERLISEE
jgi:5-methylthioadenosine/S-adenosylhomocysteine deaminase